MKYTFTFGMNSQLILAMILPAFIFLIPLLLAIEFSITWLPISDWTSIILTLLYFGCVLFSTLYLVKLIRVKVEVMIINDTIDFCFLKQNWFHKKDFTLHFKDLLTVSEDNDKGYDFIYFKTKSTVYPRFHLMKEENNPDFVSFKNQLHAHIENQTENDL